MAKDSPKIEARGDIALIGDLADKFPPPTELYAWVIDGQRGFMAANLDHTGYPVAFCTTRRDLALDAFINKVNEASDKLGVTIRLKKFVFVEDDLVIRPAKGSG